MPDAVTLSFGVLFAMLVQVTLTAFWAGRMTQRLVAVEKATDERSETGDKVTRLTVEMEHANAALDKMAREMEGVHRQLGNIAMGQIGKSGTL